MYLNINVRRPSWVGSSLHWFIACLFLAGFCRPALSDDELTAVPAPVAAVETESEDPETEAGRLRGRIEQIDAALGQLAEEWDQVELETRSAAAALARVESGRDLSAEDGIRELQELLADLQRQMTDIRVEIRRKIRQRPEYADAAERRQSSVLKYRELKTRRMELTEERTRISKRLRELKKAEQPDTGAK
ncbi:hypothetical protein ACFLSJ_08000 [Verrucomicrobiota bacterium]